MVEKSNKLIELFKIVILFLVLINSQSYSQLANGHDKFIGNVFGSSNAPLNFDMYWNQITPENAGKWGSVEGNRDVYNWFQLDAIYNYAKQRGLPFKFHTLVWGQQQPNWIPGSLTLQEQAEEVEEWIRLVGERYPDIDFADVVNEPLTGHAPAQYREALGGAGTTGWDWVIWAFQKARQYLPNTKLILNDYNILNSNNNTTSLIQIINLLKDRNLIDGIGIQGHRFELEDASVSVLQNNLDRLAATGLPIYISEFDLGNIGNSGTPNDAQQLEIYQRVFPVLWEHPGVEGITFWGYIQNQMWQTTAYLILTDGTERPAMQWLRDYLTIAGSFRSYQSGDWDDINTWEQYNGTAWVHPAPGIPQISNMLSILDGHTITVTTSDSTEQLNIAPGGKLIINPGVTLLVKNGNGTDLTVNGTIENYGSITTEDSTTIRFVSDGKYIHKQNGGSIPTATWGEGSTCQFDSVKTSAPSNGNQNFYNVIWNCPGQTSNLNLGWNGNTIGGDITVISTGTARWQMCAPSEGNSATVTINGDIIQTGGQFTTNGTGNGNTSIVINHNGNINVTGGNFSISRGSQGGTGTTVWNILNGNFTMTNATTQNSNSTGAKFVFSSQGVQNLTLGEGNTLTSLPIEVSSGATLDIGSSVLEGSGIFTLNPGATLGTAHQNGVDAIQVTGATTLSSEASYIFNGTSVQITGSSLPDTVKNLIVNSSSGVTLSKSVTVNGNVDIKGNGFSLGGNELIYGTEKTLRYSGSIAQTTSDAEFPNEGGPQNLIIENVAGVTLHAPRIISGSLELSGKLILGTNDFTAGTATSAGLTRYVVTSGSGSLKLINVGTSETLFPVGTSTAYAPVWVTNTGTADTIGVILESDTSPAAGGGRVRVKWNISEGTSGGGNYTLQFGWVATLENAAFRNPSREENAFIYNLTDTTEAGTGEYIMQFTTQPFTVSRGGITALGPFAVGKFIPVTEVNEKDEVLPKKLSLSQNYPNPFNPTTTIRYTLSEPSKAKVVIYNVLGVKVRTLIDSFQSAGEHSVEWDAKDDNDIPVSSGVYFYSLETGDKKLQKKMMVIR